METLRGSSIADFDDTGPSIALHREGYSKEKTPLEILNNESSLLHDQASTPSPQKQPITTSPSQDLMTSKCDPTRFRSPCSIGGSIDADLRSVSTLNPEQTINIDPLSELYPSNAVIPRPSRNSPGNLIVEKARIYDSHMAQSSLKNQGVLEDVKFGWDSSFSALIAGGISGNTLRSQPRSESSADNVLEDLNSAPPALSAVEDGPLIGCAGENAKENRIQHAHLNNKVDNRDDENKPKTQASYDAHLRRPSMPLDEVGRNLYPSRQPSPTSNCKRPPIEAEDAFLHSPGAILKKEVQASFESSEQDFLGMKTSIPEVVVPRSCAKLDCLEVDGASLSSAGNGLDSILQNVTQIDCSTAASDLSPSMALDTSIEDTFLRRGDRPADSDEAEFETDSSPLEDTTSNTSSLLSSSEDSEDDYKMLDPEEQARILMLGDGGSDNEGRGKSMDGVSKSNLKTQNERSEQIVEKPALDVTENMEIEELGTVENLVDNNVLIKAKISGEYRVLEVGSVLCLNNRSVIGVVAETLGRVQQPLYSVLFTNSAGIAEAGVEKNVAIFYVVSHSTFVFTNAIKNVKGSDASNIHDEEVGDDEMEFSDDEAEAAYKRNQKIRREERREARHSSDTIDYSKPTRGRGNRFDRGMRDQGRQFGMTKSPEEVRLSYDDPVATVQGGVRDYDGPYIPLVRPTGFHHGYDEETLGESERPPSYLSRTPDIGQNWRVRSRGESRDVGRGRGRGYQRGKNRCDYPQHLDNNQYSPAGHIASLGGSELGQRYLPTGYHHNFSQQPAYHPTNVSFISQRQAQSPSILQDQNQVFNQHNQNRPQWSHFPQDSLIYSPQTPSFPPTNQRFPAIYTQPTHLQPRNIPQGAFINPAFFAQPSQNNKHNSSQATFRNNIQSSGATGANDAFQAAQERLNLLQQLSQSSKSL